MKDSDKWFLKFCMSFVDPDNNELHCMIGFGNPELFSLLKGKTQLHMDSVFHSMLHPFVQCVVLIVCNEQTEMHVPIMHVLVIGEFSSILLHHKLT